MFMVTESQQVSAGEKIGEMGSTGNSTGSFGLGVMQLPLTACSLQSVSIGAVEHFCPTTHAAGRKAKAIIIYFKDEPL